MKKTSSGVKVLLAFFAALVFSAEASAQPPIQALLPMGAPNSSAKSQFAGRFQIVPIEYDTIGYKGAYSKKTVIKLDTVTGRTWVLQEVSRKIAPDKIGYTKYWVEIEELDGARGDGAKDARETEAEGQKK